MWFHGVHLKVRGHLVGSQLSPSPLSPEDQIQVVRLGGKHLFPLSAITSPEVSFNVF